MAHTPGPWSIQHHPSRSFVFARTKLADVYSEAWGDTGNQQANARLIAAAPDLLNALRTLVVQRDAHFHTIGAWDAARAAIAKATGGA